MKLFSELLYVMPSVLLIGAAGCMHVDRHEAAGASELASAERFKPQLATPVQVGAGRALRTVDGAVGSGENYADARNATEVLAAHDGFENANADASPAEIQEDYMRAVQTLGRRSLPFFPVFAVRPW